LRGRAGAILLAKEDVIILIALKGRVEVHEVNAVVFDVLAEDVEIIAKKELVHEGRSQRRMV
jgi:hypothetical protein